MAPEFSEVGKVLSPFALHSLGSGTPFCFTIQCLRENSAFTKIAHPSPLMVNKSHMWKSKDTIKTSALCLALTLQGTQKQLSRSDTGAHPTVF